MTPPRRRISLRPPRPRQCPNQRLRSLLQKQILLPRQAAHTPTRPALQTIPAALDAVVAGAVVDEEARVSGLWCRPLPAMRLLRPRPIPARLPLLPRRHALRKASWSSPSAYPDLARARGSSATTLRRFPAICSAPCFSTIQPSSVFRISFFRIFARC